MGTNYKQPLYGFMLNCEYHIITMISKDRYGVVPLFTDSYGIESVEADTLEECISLCSKNRWRVQKFDTYPEFFQWGIEEEKKFKMMDLWGVKDLTGRNAYIEDNEEELKENIFNKFK
jgi:hypothetical protein